MSQELQIIFEIAGTFFQFLLSTIFCKRSGTFSETFLTLSLLEYNIFSKNPSGFCFLINLKMSLPFSSALIKKKKFKSIQAHCWTHPPPPFQCYLSLSVWYVCVLFIYTISYLHITAAVSTWQVVLIYNYMGLSIYWFLSVLCIFCVYFFYRSIISLSEITHQIWQDHPFSQRNKTSKIALGGRLEATERGIGQNFEKVGQAI